MLEYIGKMVTNLLTAFALLMLVTPKYFPKNLTITAQSKSSMVKTIPIDCDEPNFEVVGG